MQVRTWIAGLATAVLLIGCGSTDDAESSSSSSLPVPKSADVVVTANAICAEQNDLADELNAEMEERLGDSPSRDEVEAAVEEGRDQLLPGLQSMLADLEELEAPAGDEGLWNEGLGVIEAAVTGLENDPWVLADPQAFAYPDGVAYGLDECFTDPAPPTFVPVEDMVK